MIPEAVVAMLACARIDAVHSVVFAGFSAEALRSRVQDAECKVIITADQGKRGGKTTHLKKIVDDALESNSCLSVEKVLVFKRTGEPSVKMNPARDIWWEEVVPKQRPYCVPEIMDSEDPLFMLYTSGSTGKPKGLLHSSAGYLFGATATCKYVFDHHDGVSEKYNLYLGYSWLHG